ncbi:sarcosine oxidase [Paraburkholderia sp. GAS199]|uniref:NAD(P)/FAD-dependent oxidoreductase n=1 Tax=Paraburkholderia sp. GAS199 TaxID=3035126 RepID=UPI003D1A82A5
MRVIIVGAGIAGLCTAWSLTKTGHDVTLIEQGSIPNPLAASGDRHRMIRRAYGNADGYARTIAEAFDSWDLLWNDLGVSHYANCGVLGISQFAGDSAEVFRHGLDRMGFEYEALDPQAAAERYPFLDPATFRYAYLDHDGGALFSERIARDVKTWLKLNGADIRTQSKVLAVDPHKATVRLADDTTVQGDRVVVTTGAWTSQLFPALAEDLMTYRNVVAYLEPPADLEAAWSTAPAIVDIGGTSEGYALPSVDGIGLKFGAGSRKTIAVDPDANRAPTFNEGEQLRRLFSPPFSRIDEYTVEEIRSCAYTFTKDQRFFSKRIGHALVVSACSGHGYKFGAAVGRRIAETLESDDDATLARWLRAESA